MNLGIESETLEFKKSTSELSKGVVSLASMLNKHGEGTLYFGVKNDGTIIGQKDITESTLRDVSRYIAENINPQVIPHISVEYLDDKSVIKVYVKGNDAPYSAYDVYYIRSADEDKKMDKNTLKAQMFKNGLPDVTVSTPSYNQNLSFEVIKGYFIAHGKKLNNDTFEESMSFYTSDGKYNRLAELLSDKNNTSILVVTFAGRNKSKEISRTDYGNKCLITSVYNVLDYIESINQTKVKIGGFERKEEKYFDFDCFKEAWLNAVVHNRWVNGAPPSVQIFDDRIEIISDGGLPTSLTEEDYFRGVSKPVNEKLLNIFLQLGLIDKTGHGVPLILEKYGKKVFYISKETIIITIPLNKTPIDNSINTEYYDLNKTETRVLNELKIDNTLTIAELSNIIGLSDTAINNARDNLKDKGYIERVGSNKVGYWKILK